MQLYQFEKIYSQMEKEFVDTWEKQSRANRYFNFIESYMGNQIKGTEMEFSILSTGLINM